MSRADIDRDLEKILLLGIRNTAEVIERLRKEGHSVDDILPAIYQALLVGKVDPRGTKSPFMGN